MKKILAISAAFAFIFAVSCSKKNEESKENSAAEYTAESTSAIVTDTTETTAEKAATTAQTSNTTAVEITDTEKTENISESNTAVKSEFKEYVLDDFTDITVMFNMQESDIPQSAAECEVYDLSQVDFNYPKAECEFVEDEEYSQPIIRCTAFDGNSFYYLACYDIKSLASGIAYAPKCTISTSSDTTHPQVKTNVFSLGKTTLTAIIWKV